MMDSRRACRAGTIDLQFGVAGRALSLSFGGLAGVLAARLADALMPALAVSRPNQGSRLRRWFF
jgi:hypothetical protein